MTVSLFHPPHRFPVEQRRGGNRTGKDWRVHRNQPPRLEGRVVGWTHVPVGVEALTTCQDVCPDSAPRGPTYSYKTKNIPHRPNTHK